MLKIRDKIPISQIKLLKRHSHLFLRVILCLSKTVYHWTDDV